MSMLHIGYFIYNIPGQHNTASVSVNQFHSIVYFRQKSEKAYKENGPTTNITCLILDILY